MANWSSPKEGYVPSYQISGKPYVAQVSAVATAGGTKVTFPQVTRWIQVTNNTATDVKLGFSAHGVDGTEDDYFITIPGKSKADQNSTGILELRCKSIFLKSTSGAITIDVAAGLTDILDLTTKLSGSEGVG